MKWIDYSTLFSELYKSRVVIFKADASINKYRHKRGTKLLGLEITSELHVQYRKLTFQLLGGILRTNWRRRYLEL
jgi:hypothetical protein